MNKGNHFYIGVDTAEGISVTSTEPDYSSIVVFNEAGIQVYADHTRENLDDWAGTTRVDPITGKAVEFDGTVLKVIKMFSPCTVVVEKNGPGVAVVNRIDPHMPDDANLIVLSMSGGIKPQLVSDFALEMADEQVISIDNGNVRTARRIIFTDNFTVQCLRQYVKIGPGKFSAAPGFYDDPVVACLWATYAKRIMGAVDGVALLPSERDVTRPIHIDKEDDLRQEDVGAFGPSTIPKDNEELMEGMSVNPYSVNTGRGFDTLSPKQGLGGRNLSLEGRDGRY
jgi:hypothetical protein